MFVRTTIPVSPGPVTRLGSLLALCAGVASVIVDGHGFFMDWLAGFPGWKGAVLCLVASWWGLIVGAPLEFRLGRGCLSALLGAALLGAAWLAALGVPAGTAVVWFSLLTGVQLGVIPWARVLTVVPFFRYFWPIVEAPGLLVPLLWCCLVAALGESQDTALLIVTVLLIAVGFVLGRICERAPSGRRTIA